MQVKRQQTTDWFQVRKGVCQGCILSPCLFNLYPEFPFSAVAQSCPTLCNLMDCSTPGLPVYHQLPEFTQTHVHWVGDAIQPSHPLSPFSSHHHSFPASGFFPMSQLFASGGQSIGASALVLPKHSYPRKTQNVRTPAAEVGSFL